MDRPSSGLIECVPFPCPHCRAELEVRDDGWTGWRLCPACDRPLLPPDPAEDTPAAWRSAATATPAGQAFAPSDSAEDVLIIGPSAEDRPSSPLWMPQQFEPYGRAQRARRRGLVRRILTFGLALSIFAILVAFLEDSNLALGFFSLVSLVLFLLLMRPARGD